MSRHAVDIGQCWTSHFHVDVSHCHYNGDQMTMSFFPPLLEGSHAKGKPYLWQQNGEWKLSVMGAAGHVKSCDLRGA